MQRPRMFHPAAALLWSALSLAATAAAAPWCGGDCNADESVAIWEIVRGIAISLDTPDAASCAAADRNLDASVSIDELMLSVNHALDGCPGDDTAFATAIAADFSGGGFSAVDLDQRSALFPADEAHPATTDSVPRSAAGLVLVVNRFGANSITARDPRDDYSTLWECSTGIGSNPQDVVVIDANKAYATLLSEADLLIFDPSPAADCSDFEIGRIDLSSLADEDGIPEMTQMALDEGLLYVALQKLTNFVASGPGAIAIVDTETDELVDSWDLSGANPFAATKGLTVIDGELYVPQIGAFGVQDGGLERIDLADGASQGFLIDEQTLSGDLNDFAILDPSTGYAVVGLADFTSMVVGFDPSTGELGETLIGAGANISDIEINDRGELFVADRGAVSGVRVFDAVSGSELTSDPIDTGLPPFQLLFLR